MARIQNVDWSRLGIEGVAIVLSILFAFWIDAWWEDRSDHDALAAQLRALENEVLNNERLINAQIEGQSRSLSAMGRVFTALANTDARQLPESFLTDVGESLWVSGSPIAMSLYQEILNSGTLQKVHNPQLSLAVGDYAWLASRMEGSFDYVSTSYVSLVVPTLGRHMALSDLGWTGYESYLSPKGEVTATIPAAPFSLDQDGMRSREVWNVLYHWKTVQIDNMDDLNNMKVRIVRLKGLLRAEIERLDR